LANISEIGRCKLVSDEKQPQILRLLRCKSRTFFAQDDRPFIPQAFTSCLYVDTAWDAERPANEFGWLNR
jgi:hypothetical protein